MSEKVSDFKNIEMIKPKPEPIRRTTLTAIEVAEYLGVSIDMVYMLVREKRLVHFRIGRRVLFKKEAVDNWIQERMEEAMKNE